MFWRQYEAHKWVEIYISRYHLVSGPGVFSMCLSSQPHSPQYYSPLQNADYVSTGATIAVRYGPVLSEQNLASLKLIVSGLKSGLHAGQTILADDHKTVIYKPAIPFTPGEQVKVDIPGLAFERADHISPTFLYLYRCRQPKTGFARKLHRPGLRPAHRRALSLTF